MFFVTASASSSTIRLANMNWPSTTAAVDETSEMVSDTSNITDFVGPVAGRSTSTESAFTTGKIGMYHFAI